jgi:protein-S-isoprenylcysteine O-methyltransferase Ste14
MSESAWLIIIHQVLFQGMFVAKNLRLQRRLGQPVRGGNREANLAIGVFAIFIGSAIYLAIAYPPPQSYGLLDPGLARTLSLLLMLLSLLVARAALRDLGDSWRIGVIEQQQTELIERGIYRFSRNPFFVAYLLLFAAYTAELQNPLLLLLLCACFAAVHSMILREEQFLAASHGAAYEAYKQRVPRYLGL